MKKRMKKTAAILIAVLAAAVLTACDGGKEVSSSSSAPQISSQAEASAAQGTSSQVEQEPFYVSFDTEDLDGNSVNSEIFADYKLTVLNIWGTWCPPCVNELPELQETSQAYAEKNVQLIGVLQDSITNTMERDETIIANAKKLMETAGADYTVLLPDETFYNEILSQVQYFPTTLFIDEKGQLVYAVERAMTFEEWSSTIDAVLAEMEK